MANPDVEVEQLPVSGRWIWIYQAPGGGFYRSPAMFSTKTAARKAGRAWLTRRANPRNRGR
jgi:hypothetical protein